MIELRANQITADQAATFLETSEITNEVRADGLTARTVRHAGGGSSVLVQGLGEGFIQIEASRLVH